MLLRKLNPPPILACGAAGAAIAIEGANARAATTIITAAIRVIFFIVLPSLCPPGSLPNSVIG
jgi:hypothetical protein